MNIPEIERLEESKKYSYIYSWLKINRTNILQEAEREPLEKLSLESTYWRRIEDAYGKAASAGLGTVEGKEQIFNILKESILLLDKVVVSCGPLPEPGVSSGNGLDKIKPFAGNNLDEGFDYVCDWLKGEMGYQLQKYGTDFSDKAIVAKLDGNNPLWHETRMRFHRTGILGIETLNGRQSLAKYSSLVVAIAAATIRNFGEIS